MTLRLVRDEGHYTRIAELLSLLSNETVTAAGLLEDDARIVPGKIRQRWVIEADDGIAGCAMVVKYPSEPAGLFHLELVVDPAQRGQGFGRQLYASALDFAQSNGMMRLMSEVRDDDPYSLNFAQRRNFAIAYQTFDSVLDVATFDEGQFAGIIETLENEGIHFCTLANFGADETAERKLYEVNRMAVLDEPGSTGTFPAYENWRRIILESGWFRRESQFIALDGERFIGLAGVYNEPETPQDMFNGLTGVDPAYRGRKIALALKLLTIHYARQHGAATINTGNDARNAPMLAINAKLGYQRLNGHYALEAIFQPS